MFTKYIIVFAVLTVAVLGFWVALLEADKAKLEQQNQYLTRTVSALKEQSARAKEARAVEAARAKRWQARAAELDASIESLFTGEIPDVPLDPRIIAYIDAISGRMHPR
tara:strand:+ start:8344 stop:8670 length:327 start_codon:yes stop_codon:yes gene_type:complete